MSKPIMFNAADEEKDAVVMYAKKRQRSQTEIFRSFIREVIIPSVNADKAAEQLENKAEAA